MVLSDDAFCGLVYSTNPVLLLFGDQEERLVEARVAAERADCRVVGEVAIGDGVDRLDWQAGFTVALVTASEPSSAFEALLARIGAEGRTRPIRGLIVAPSGMIDVIAAADLPVDVDQLVDPDLEALTQEIRLATEPTEPRLNELGRPTVLQQLSEEAARIANILASLSEDDAAGREPRSEEAADAGFVRGIIRARRLRDQFFRGELFADPAYDILLDLYAARLEESRVAVSSLCIAAAVPATTALRWIKHLTDRGLLVRTADPQDGRRVYIGLSDDTARAMARYLASVQKSGLPAI